MAPLCTDIPDTWAILMGDFLYPLGRTIGMETVSYGSRYKPISYLPNALSQLKTEEDLGGSTNARRVTGSL